MVKPKAKAPRFEPAPVTAPPVEPPPRAPSIPDYAPPEESGLPPGGEGEYDDPYEQILFNMGLLEGSGDNLTVTDPFAAELVWQGWYDPDYSPELRHDAREAFFEYMGYERDDFDWDEWRDWYSASAA